ncbi:hypothetical protein RFI_16850 [Reticulomyxa filosa]|uniref:SAM domain-containing protein n=1 Tax=Reticulomyxa filosa TaxID=46433 RepID=X6N3D4_RETFI|nr:hypothetical protein RFI_16850 [Reticulomyxa filosa]|eukprot:ETO20368.1 hypothetical protein RFI_16850 [Reticulomyxa filosa]
MTVWLKAFGCDGDKYGAQLKEKGILSLETLLSMNGTELRAVINAVFRGCDALTDKKRVLTAVEKLKSKLTKLPTLGSSNTKNNKEKEKEKMLDEQLASVDELERKIRQTLERSRRSPDDEQQALILKQLLTSATESTCVIEKTIQNWLPNNNKNNTKQKPKRPLFVCLFNLLYIFSMF